MGDPAGIGPELCLRAVADKAVLGSCLPLVFGDDAVLRQAASACGLPPLDRVIPLAEWQQAAVRAASADKACAAPGPALVDCAALKSHPVQPGRVDRACGQAAYAYVEAAVRAALEGAVAAMVTAPVHKESLHLAGIPHPGHTEILAALTRADRVCMMMVSEEISVSLVTTHLRYTEVAEAITSPRILDVIELTDQALRTAGCPDPKIAVCGLNPHGGEHGLFGTEEERIIEPAIREAQARGINVAGPLVPDTAFLPATRSRLDAYVAMYHDQGLTPFKMLAFDKGVNVTLGLPVIRTSVDHGTAFDIAWQGVASAKSLVKAVEWAVRLCRQN